MTAEDSVQYLHSAEDVDQAAEAATKLRKKRARKITLDDGASEAAVTLQSKDENRSKNKQKIAKKKIRIKPSASRFIDRDFCNST